jgi:hypothetical protein
MSANCLKACSVFTDIKVSRASIKKDLVTFIYLKPVFADILLLTALFDTKQSTYMGVW